jgi:hypothetical protein
MSSYPGDRTSVAIRDGANLDAFSRLRISSNHILFGSSFKYDLLPWVYEQSVTGGAAITHLPNEAAAQMIVAGAADAAILQSYKHIPYRPGQSQMCFFTFTLGAGSAGVIKRIGLFDPQNGLFLEQNGLTLNVVRRTYATGVAVDNPVAQAAWNIDVMDGTGPSGITLDVTKSQILVIDFQWLGMGRVRFGFDIDGVLHYVHEMRHANVLDTVYMSRGTLPVRAEITSAGNPEDMKYVCASVVREGGEEEPLYIGSTSTADVSAAGQNLTTTMQTMISIRLRNDFIHSTLAAVGIHILNTGNSNLYWELALVRGFTGASLNPWSNTGTATSVSTTVSNLSPATGGVVLDSGILMNGTANDRTSYSKTIRESILSAYNKMDGTPDILVLRAKALTTTTTGHFIMHFAELY